jgi:predicted DNA-binding transcriptional regulator AlpA
MSTLEPETAPAAFARDPAASHGNLPAPTPALLAKPWVYLGLSRSAFFRLRSADKAPRPVVVPGSRRPMYRRVDLDKWVAQLPFARRGGDDQTF